MGEGGGGGGWMLLTEGAQGTQGADVAGALPGREGGSGPSAATVHVRTQEAIEAL